MTLSSLHSASSEGVSRNDASYFFVLENTQTKTLHGTARILAAVGTDSHPIVGYELCKSGQGNDISNYSLRPALLTEDSWTVGPPSELATLYLDPNQRAMGLGKLLSFSRFMYMGAHAQNFGSQLLAEMRGISNADGKSAFYTFLNETWFKMDYRDANQALLENPRALYESLPQEKTLINKLPKDVQAAVAQVHPKTAAAYRLLQKIGLQPIPYIELLDGGPKLMGDVSQVHPITEQKEVLSIQGESYGSARYKLLVSNTHRQQFSCIICHSQDINNETLRLNSHELKQLEINAGDPVRYIVIQDRLEPHT